MSVSVAIRCECAAIYSTLSAMIDAMRLDVEILVANPSPDNKNTPMNADVYLLCQPTSDNRDNARSTTIVLGDELHDMAADIRLTLPVSFAQLSYAMRRALIMHQQRPVALAHAWQFDALHKRITHESHPPIMLTDKEVALFSRLLKAQGEMVTKEGLLRDVWAYEDGVDSHTLETHIYRLRNKCEAMGQAAPVIRAHENGYSVRF